MSLCRPIGHIAGNLTFAAIGISMRVKHSANDAIHVCWLTDDGCIRVQQSAHPDVRAVMRSTSHQIINRYRKQAEFGWREIEADLEQARADFAQNALAEAIAA